MKKTFDINHPKIKPARRVEAIKHEVKKYLKRERKKTLPEDFDYWDFDCKFGNTEKEAEVVQLSEITKRIDAAVANDLTSFYIEILVKAAVKQQKDEIEEEEEEEEE